MLVLTDWLVRLTVRSVLTLAWHRLYLRGVPKTYNIRLRVLNYISLCVLLLACVVVKS